MKPTLAILAGLFALSAVSPALASQFNVGMDRERYCLTLFFTNHAQHARECPNDNRPEPGSIHTLSGPANPPVVVPDEPVVKPKKKFKKPLFKKFKKRRGRG